MGKDDDLFYFQILYYGILWYKPDIPSTLELWRYFTAPRVRVETDHVIGLCIFQSPHLIT